MKDPLENYKSQEERELIAGKLELLKESEAWKLVEQVILCRRETAVYLLQNGLSENETLEDILRARDAIRAYDEFLETPKKLINDLMPPHKKEETDDPFI